MNDQSAVLSWLLAALAGHSICHGVMAAASEIRMNLEKGCKIGLYSRAPSDPWWGVFIAWSWWSWPYLVFLRRTVLNVATLKVWTRPSQSPLPLAIDTGYRIHHRCSQLAKCDSSPESNGWAFIVHYVILWRLVVQINAYISFQMLYRP